MSRLYVHCVAALSAVASSCSTPEFGSPEPALQLYVASEQGVAQSDVSTLCTCGEVFNYTLQCRCWAAVGGIERPYECACPAGRGTFPWQTKPCACARVVLAPPGTAQEH